MLIDLPSLVQTTLSELDKDEVSHLLFTIAHAIASFRVEKYPSGTYLCRQGADEDLFYIIAQGTVDIYRNMPNGEREFLSSQGPGEYFGEMALLLNKPRTADVVTSTDVVMLELDRYTFLSFINRSHHFAELMARSTQLNLDNHFHREEQKRGKSYEQFSVFVSYSRENSDIVHKIIKDLQEQLTENNVELWLDTEQIESGQHWDDAIDDALDDCGAMLLFMSEPAANSRHVKDEYCVFLDENKPIIPVLLETCKLSSRIRRLQYIDYHRANYHAVLAQIHEAILLEARKQSETAKK